MLINRNEIESIGHNILEEIKNNNYSNTLEKILITNTLLMSYDSLKSRFDSNNVSYNFSPLEDLQKIFGFKIDNIEGYNELDNYYKEIFNNHILNYINSVGLDYKIYNLPRKIILEVENNRFKIYTLEINKFSYLSFDGTWY